MRTLTRHGGNSSTQGKSQKQGTRTSGAGRPQRATATSAQRGAAASTRRPSRASKAQERAEVAKPVGRLKEAPAEILYEDNHLIIVNKEPGQLSQGDKTGDHSLDVLIKAWIKQRDKKPGNVYLGIPHRLDRPVGGVMIYAKTDKALSRLAEAFRAGKIKKIYWALVSKRPPEVEDELVSWLKKTESNNTSRVVKAGTKGAKEARLHYKLLAAGKNFHLVEVELKTGRHHQIRVQLASLGCPIRGDLKYGAARSLRGGGISLLARSITFPHPIGGELISIEAPAPREGVWQELING